MDERIEKAVLFMESNCQRKLRLRQIAAKRRIIPSRLSAPFPGRFGGQAQCDT